MSDVTADACSVFISSDAYELLVTILALCVGGFHTLGHCGGGARDGVCHVEVG